MPSARGSEGTHQVFVNISSKYSKPFFAAHVRCSGAQFAEMASAADLDESTLSPLLSQKFKFLGTIGQGSFGVVSKIIRRSDGRVGCKDAYPSANEYC